MNLKQVKRLIKEQISRLQNPGTTNRLTPKRQTHSANGWNQAIPMLMQEFGNPQSKQEFIRKYSKWYNTCHIGGCVPTPQELQQNIDKGSMGGRPNDGPKAIPFWLAAVGVAAVCYGVGYGINEIIDWATPCP
jgi:hypothetical protein